MSRFLKAASPLLLTILIGTFVAGILFALAGVWLVYLGATGSSEIVMFGQTLKSSSVGVSAIFIGAIAIVVTLRRVLVTIERGADPAKASGATPTKAWPSVKTGKTLATHITKLSKTQRALLQAAVMGQRAYVCHLESDLGLKRSEIMYRAKELQRDELIELENLTDVLLVPTGYVTALLEKPDVKNALNQNTKAA